MSGGHFDVSAASFGLGRQYETGSKMSNILFVSFDIKKVSDVPKTMAFPVDIPPLILQIGFPNDVGL